MLTLLAGEACPYPRGQVCICMHCQWMQDEVQLTGEGQGESGREMKEAHEEKLASK